jgi:signal recognition particle receptor subunit beta
MGVAAPAKPFPWWILIVICLAIVLVGVLVYVLLPQKVDVPNVVQRGLSLEEAKKEIEGVGLSVKEVSQESDEIEGKVIDQKPQTGKLKKGGIVELTVAVRAMVDVPMVTGRPFREAAREIARNGLIFEKIEKEDPNVLEEIVAAQDPTEGKIKKGGAVKLTVSVPSAQPKQNIVLLGPQGSGKTTLASAISKVLNDSGRSTYVTYDTLAENQQKQVEFKTAKFSYRLVDLPDDVGLARFLLDEKSKADAAILVVSAVDDRSRTPEFLDLAKRKGISSLVVFISKADLVPERDRLGSNIPHSRVERFDPISNVSMTFVAQEARPRRPLRQLLEVEIRKLLTERGYDGAGTPVVFGSALGALQGDAQWRASVMQLVKLIEDYIEPRLQGTR